MTVKPCAEGEELAACGADCGGCVWIRDYEKAIGKRLNAPMTGCYQPCHSKTYDNAETVRAMVEAQGFVIAENGTLTVPDGAAIRMTVPTELLPRCPVCGRAMTMNLRSDERFVEDEGWLEASGRYSDFLQRWQTGRVLYLELGVGYNTPVIIKYPFWRRTAQNPQAVYACVNYGEALCPKELEGQAICIDGDIAAVLRELS